MTQIVFEEDFQCDYDVEPTNIYLLIQERDWDGVVYQADTFPCEVKTFVFRKDAKHPQGLKWRVLPIHAAILNGAPTHAVSALINAYPDSAKETDDQGMLPIHIAIKKHVEPEVLNILLAAFPGCVDVKSEKSGLTPLEMATSSSSVHKEYYIRALTKGSATYSAISDPLSDLLCGIDFKSIIGVGPSLVLSR